MNRPLFDDQSSGAEFSGDYKHRYALWRIWDESKPLVMFIGLNPSTANETTNDPTIRRVIGMAKQWGFGGVYMMNCFTYVSTDPNELVKDKDLEWNNRRLLHIARRCQEIVFAWGAFEAAKERGQELAAMFPKAKALIINQDGSPRHPLYVPKSVRLVDYAPTHPAPAQTPPPSPLAEP